MSDDSCPSLTLLQAFAAELQLYADGKTPCPDDAASLDLGDDSEQAADPSTGSAAAGSSSSAQPMLISTEQPLDTEARSQPRPRTRGKELGLPDDTDEISDTHITGLVSLGKDASMAQTPVVGLSHGAKGGDDDLAADDLDDVNLLLNDPDMAPVPASLGGPAADLSVIEDSVLDGLISSAVAACVDSSAACVDSSAACVDSSAEKP